MKDILFGEEDAPYIKTKQKRPHIRSKHKHNYEYYYVTNSRDFEFLVEACSECGRIKNINTRFPRAVVYGSEEEMEQRRTAQDKQWKKYKRKYPNIHINEFDWSYKSI